jgi:hypothetical protein
MVSILNRLKILFTPKNRHIFVVRQGPYVGEWLLRVKQDKDTSIFFSLPDKFIRSIPNKDVEWGLKNDVIDIGGVIPQGVYNVCIAEYYNSLSQGKPINEPPHQSTFNRREQHASPDPLDSEQSGGEDDNLDGT